MVKGSYRTFDGKRYSIAGRYQTKREATNRANQMRKEGWYVRVAKEKWAIGDTTYGVFVRVKR